MSSGPLVPIVLQLESAGAESGWIQPFAGGKLWTEQPLAADSAGAACAEPSQRPVMFGSASRSATWTTTYEGPGLIDGGLRMLRAALSADGERRVEFEDGESFRISAPGDCVRRSGPRPPDAHSLERALGAPLALALALRGIYLLHASALAFGTRNDGAVGNVLAFTAPSGAGKSTLAATANGQVIATSAGSDSEAGGDMGETGDAGKGNVRWIRVADDILPVRLAPLTQALPHYPQLKLPGDANWPQTAASALPLTHLVEIEHSATCGSVEIERLPAAAACLAIARATVAAKLFDRELLAAHFEHCAAAAEKLAVHRLRFPSGLDRLPAVLAAISGVSGVSAVAAVSAIAASAALKP